MTRPNWKIFAQTRDRLGESPMWHVAEQALYWVDWYGPTIHRLKHGGQKVESWTIPGETTLGSFVFAAGGRLLIAVDSGLKLFDPATGAITLLRRPERGPPRCRLQRLQARPFRQVVGGHVRSPRNRSARHPLLRRSQWPLERGDSGFPSATAPPSRPTAAPCISATRSAAACWPMTSGPPPAC